MLPVYENNVRTKEETQETISKVLKYTAEIVGSTLGAYGQNIILKNSSYEHSFSKDGFSVLDRMMFRDDAESMVFEIIKRISHSLVRKVGDGSTSSIVAANHLYHSLLTIKQENKRLSPKRMIDILNKIIHNTEEELLKLAKQFPEDDDTALKNIAFVSCNNDQQLGDMVYEVCQKFPESNFINIEKSRTEETSYKIERGFPIHSGRVTDFGINSPHDLGCYYDDILILQCKGIMNKDAAAEAIQLASELFLNKQPFCIVASQIDMDAREAFTNFYRLHSAKKFEIVVIESGNNTDDQIKRNDDLEEFIGSKAVDFDRGDTIKHMFEVHQMNLFGKCKTFRSRSIETLFVDGKGVDSEQFNEWVNGLEAEAEKYEQDSNNADSVRFAKEFRIRAIRLRHGVASIYIGGMSEAEKESRKFLIDDAINAMYAAKQFGYVIGGNISIPFILKRSLPDIFGKEEILITKAIISAFTSVYRSVLLNYTEDMTELMSISKACYDEEEPQIFNLTSGCFETIETTNIISPVKTDVEIFKTAVNIVGHLLSTSHIVTGNFARN